MHTHSNTALSKSILVTSERHAARLAQHIRTGLGAGDALLLSGPIGAGKSHFARAIIRAFLQDSNVAGDIPSPTFTLVQTYIAGDLEIWHSDLYRLTHVDEVVELGLAEAFETALCLVEWPDRLGIERPHNALSLNFAMADQLDHRTVTFSAFHQKWLWLTDALQQFGRVDA